MIDRSLYPVNRSMTFSTRSYSNGSCIPAQAPVTSSVIGALPETFVARLHRARSGRLAAPALLALAAPTVVVGKRGRSQRDSPSAGFSTLEHDAEDLLEVYQERCVEALEGLSPEERREVYKLLDLTVETYPDGRLEAAWALNTRISKVRFGSRPPCGLCS